MAFNKRFIHLIGATGAASDENRSTKRFGILFEVPMLMAALWIDGAIG